MTWLGSDLVILRILSSWWPLMMYNFSEGLTLHMSASKERTKSSFPGLVIPVSFIISREDYFFKVPYRGNEKWYQEQKYPQVSVKIKRIPTKTPKVIRQQNCGLFLSLDGYWFEVSLSFFFNLHQLFKRKQQIKENALTEVVKGNTKII